MKMENVKEIVFKYVDRLSEGREFTPREIAGYVSNYMISWYGAFTLPYSGTITRYLRERRSSQGDVYCKDRNKSIYVKK